MSERRKVHVIGADGHPRFNRLYDDGGDILPFDSSGWLDRRGVQRRGETIKDGWFSPEEWEALKRAKWHKHRCEAGWQACRVTPTRYCQCCGLYLCADHAHEQREEEA